MAIHIEGAVCKRCGSTSKWIYGGCVQCAKDRSVTWKRANKDKVAAYAKSYNANNKDRILTNHRRRLPKPTRPCPEECEMCGKPPKRNALNLDHCHKRNVFRGWLCWDCNVALGKLGDSIDQAICAINRYRLIANVTD